MAKWDGATLTLVKRTDLEKLEAEQWKPPPLEKK
jgi:hypothetical protein